jgi:hypothetical protein
VKIVRINGPVNPNDVDGMVFHILGQILVPTSGTGKRSLLNEAPRPSISHFVSSASTLLVPITTKGEGEAGTM